MTNEENTIHMIVDIGDLKVSNSPNTIILTHALGSCIGVTVWDPFRHVGGLLHYLLPLSTAVNQMLSIPAKYGDLGIPLLFERMYALGSHKRDLIVTVAGGACINTGQNIFDIGRRNYNILRKLFWKNDVLIAAEDVGGSVSRTMQLNVGTGTVMLRVHGTQTVLWDSTKVTRCA